MVDKSFTALPRFISEGILGNLVGTSPPTTTVAPEGISRGFELFVQSVRKAKNKYDEQQIINRELQTVETQLSQGNISMVQQRDFLCRVIYCHMLGYDVKFGLIPAIQLTQSGKKAIDRRTGYLACSLLMTRDHELSLLLTSTFQKDMSSGNLLDNLSGLSGASQLAHVEMIPHILTATLSLLKHPRELVRQKAVMCLYQFQLLAPDLLEHNRNDLLKMLFDKDPGVMAAAVNIVQNFIQRTPEKYESFGETLVSILKQISSHKMATMYEYHTVPFPWLQIQIIRCLAKLSSVHKSLATTLAPLLEEILQKTTIKEPIAFAILYECIQCIMVINPPKPLLDEAAEHIQRFLVSNNPNLKFIGVKLLVSLVQVNPEYSVNYQQLIVQSLENPDLTVQKKMHRLLYEIANDTNVTVVCAKLLTQLQTSADKFWRSEVITMVISLVDRIDSDKQWQIETIFTCLQYGDDVIKDDSLNKVMDMLERSDADQKGQKMLVQKCVGILVNKSSLGTSLHISTWVLGELCSFLKNMPDDKVISLFSRHLTNGSQAYSLQSSTVTALQNLVRKGVVDYDAMATKINECLNTDLPVMIKQHLSVILGVCKHHLTLSYHDDMDTTLTFLDDMVVDDLEQGGNPYIPPHLRGVSLETEMKSSVSSEMSKPEETTSSGRPRTESTTSSTKTTEESDTGLKLQGVKRVWGKQGRIDDSSKIGLEETFSTNTTVQTEEEIRQKELASALFGGFKEKLQSKPEAIWEDTDDVDFLPDSADTAGWRNLHSTAVGAVSSPKQNDLMGLYNSESFLDDEEVVKLPNVTDNLISIENRNTGNDILDINTQTVYSGSGLSGDSEASFSEMKRSSANNDHFEIPEKSKASSPRETNAAEQATGRTEGCEETDLDEAISVLLDNCDIKDEQKISNKRDNLLLQLDSTTFFPEQFTHEDRGCENVLELGTETNISDNIYSDYKDVAQGAGLINTIYQDDISDGETDQVLSESNKTKSTYSLES